MLSRLPKFIVALLVALGVYARAAYGDDAPATPPVTDGSGSGSDAPAPPAPVDDFPDTIPGLSFVHFHSHLQVHTFGGSDLSLPKGWYFDEPTYDKLDTRMKTDEDAVTRLTAENAVLKQGVEGWQPGWITVVSIAVTCFAGGWYVHSKL